MVTDTSLDQAVQQLLAGRLVAFPTETVYGLGADASQADAVARIYAVKGRPAGHPLIVHLAPGADLSQWAADVPAEAQALADAFWPGPLTMILRRAPQVPDAACGGLGTIGLRCPSHPVAQALLRAFDAARPGGLNGLAAPSANRFGRVSPTLPDHVQREFPQVPEDQLLVLPGGAAEVGIESTIVDLSRLDSAGPVLLRPGHISAEALATVLGRPVRARPDAQAPQVSGSLASHYAPSTPLSVLPRAALAAQAAAWAGQGERVAVVLFPPLLSEPLSDRVHQFLCPVDPVAYARELYALLHQLDASGADRLLFEQPPQDDAAWQAVNDRLTRASA